MLKRWISFLLFFTGSFVQGQDIYKDRSLLTSGTLHAESRFEGRKVKSMEGKSRSVFAKYNPVQLVFTGLMFGYQKVISPQLNATCIYTPSCSAFGKALVGEFGLIKGVFLTADRLMRCNRAGAMEISPLTVDEHLHLAKDDVNYFKVSRQ